MELRLRPILAVLAVAALALALALVPRFLPEAADQPASAAGPALTYIDASAAWDWQAACESQFRQFLAVQLPDQPIRSVQVTLIDAAPARQLPFGTVYRAAKVNGNCTNAAGDFACELAVTAGEPGADLATATTLNTPYTLLDMFLAKGANPDAVRGAWSLATFQPLLVQEADQWQSTCLQISRAR